MARWFETIGGFAKPENICGYCLRKKDCVTDQQAYLHHCFTRQDGEPCDKMRVFHYVDDRDKTSPLKGEQYRQSLKKKKKKRR